MRYVSRSGAIRSARHQHGKDSQEKIDWNIITFKHPVTGQTLYDHEPGSKYDQPYKPFNHRRKEDWEKQAKDAGWWFSQKHNGWINDDCRNEDGELIVTENAEDACFMMSQS